MKNQKKELNSSFLICCGDIKLTTSENETAQIKQLCIPQAPSVSFADSSLPEGASSYMFFQKTAMLTRKRSLKSEPPSGREVARRSRDGRSLRAQMRLYFIKLRSFSGASRLGTLGISSPNPRQGTSPLDPMFASRLSKKLNQLNPLFAPSPLPPQYAQSPNESESSVRRAAG